MKQYGLVGKHIDYSFSREYFKVKFDKEGLSDHTYVNYDFTTIEGFAQLLSERPLPTGLNVTIPYKKEVIPFLDRISEEAQVIEAVNTIIWEKDGSTTGHNTDHTGFQKALQEAFTSIPRKALILGTGGASGAVKYVLKKLGCEFTFVSRNPTASQLSYEALNESLMKEVDLIVNTTPLGTFPDIEKAPPLPYQWISNNHMLFDLIYNPSETNFLRLGKNNGARTCNGHKMLVYQAEKSWELWNS